MIELIKGKCGHDIYKPPARLPEPCQLYCCAHCPQRKRLPCPMEVQEGIFTQIMEGFNSA